MLATEAWTVDIHLEENHDPPRALASLHGRDSELSADGLPPVQGGDV
ncbi:hypothetical protein [Saccharopolyspora sp. NPDC049426]